MVELRTMVMSKKIKVYRAYIPLPKANNFSLNKPSKVSLRIFKLKRIKNGKK